MREWDKRWRFSLAFTHSDSEVQIERYYGQFCRKSCCENTNLLQCEDMLGTIGALSGFHIWLCRVSSVSNTKEMRTHPCQHPITLNYIKRAYSMHAHASAPTSYLGSSCVLLATPVHICSHKFVLISGDPQASLPQKFTSCHSSDTHLC